MKILIKLKTVKLFVASCIMASSLLFSGCLTWDKTLPTHESQAIKIVQDLLKMQQPLKAEPLVGGLSQASLMKITGADKVYVVRFLDKLPEQLRQNEMTCQQIASDSGYGPHVYFVDRQREIIVMEYIIPEAFPSDNNRLEAYANLVKKIHSGPAFPATSDLFAITEGNLNTIAPFQQNLIDVPKIKAIFDTIRKAVERFPHNAPCHRDLHPGNVIYARGQFFAIDYTSAGQDDPYIDLAAPLFHGFIPGSSNALLTEYLGRTPTEKELAKLSIMKSLVLIFYGVILVKHLPEGFFKKMSFQKISPRLYGEMGQQIAQGTINLGDPKNMLEFALAAFAAVVKHYNSDQFNKELMLLQEIL